MLTVIKCDGVSSLNTLKPWHSLAVGVIALIVLSTIAGCGSSSPERSVASVQSVADIERQQLTVAPSGPAPPKKKRFDYGPNTIGVNPTP